MTAVADSSNFRALMAGGREQFQPKRIRVSGGPGGVAALVLGLIGAMGLFTFIYAPLFMFWSVAAWSIGEREIQKYRALGVPVSGLGAARAGQVIGVLGVVMGSLIAALILFLISMLAVYEAQKGGLGLMLLTEF